VNQTVENNISILIKTFNRKGSLVQLLRSLEKMNCQMPILIADDSQQPYGEEIIAAFSNLSIQYYPLPFDSGLAAGRNFLLQKVQTSFFLLCDDDFVLSPETDFDKILELMEQQQLDIAGGAFLNFIRPNNLKRWIRVMLTPSLAWRYITGNMEISYHTGHFSVEDNHCKLSMSNNKPPEPVYRCDIVNNFFIGRTGQVLRIQGWDGHFKVGEHEEFFFRAKLSGLKTVYVDGFAVNHYPVSTKTYLPYRQRSLQLKNDFPEKYGFKSYTEIDKDTGKIIFTYTGQKTSHNDTKITTVTL
jgi:glycosyltransferase involved in cell wall biosynthesis